MLRGLKWPSGNQGLQPEAAGDGNWRPKPAPAEPGQQREGPCAGWTTSPGSAFTVGAGEGAQGGLLLERVPCLRTQSPSPFIPTH